MESDFDFEVLSLSLDLEPPPPPPSASLTKCTMVATVGLFVLFVLGTSWACDAKELTTTELSSGETVISDVSVLQINHQESEGIIKASEEVGRNENVCTLCEEFTAKAIEYLEDNKTQTVIIDILHNTCARLIPFEQKLEIIELLLKACDAVENYVKKCKTLVFEYGPFISEEKWRFNVFGFEFGTLRRMKYEQIADLLNGIAERFDWDKIMGGDNITGLKHESKAYHCNLGGNLSLVVPLWKHCIKPVLRMNFLSNILREEGGFDYKKAIVLDRATLYLNMLEVDGAIVEADKDVKNFLFGSLDVPLVNLEMSLKNYVQEPSEEPFDIDSVPKEVKSLPLAEKKAPSKKPTGLGAAPTAPTSTVDAYEKLLSSIPEFSSFGKLFKSSAPVELTEAETEYAVNAVTVVVDASDTEKFTEVSTRPLRSLPYDSPGQTFVVFEKPEGVPQLENSQTYIGQFNALYDACYPVLKTEWNVLKFVGDTSAKEAAFEPLVKFLNEESQRLFEIDDAVAQWCRDMFVAKVSLRASMEGFLDAFMEQVTAFPNDVREDLRCSMAKDAETIKNES
ncbi:unnamed protein product [Camellia sinensis]